MTLHVWAPLAQEQLPQPTKLERWVGEGGWFVDLLLPSTAAGVLGQAIVMSIVFGADPARPPPRADAAVGGWSVFTAGLFVLRAAH